MGHVCAILSSVRRGSIYREFLLAFLAIGMIPVVVGIVQFRAAQAATTELVVDSQASVLRLGRRLFVRQLREIDSLLVNLASEHEVKSLAPAERPLGGATPVRILEASRRLESSYPTSDFLYGLWVYYPRLDAIVGTDRNYPRFGTLWGTTYEIEGYSYEQFRREVLTASRAGELGPTLNLRNGQSTIRVVPYVRTLEGPRGIDATLIALLGVEDLLEIFAPLFTAPGSFFTIVHGDGSVIAESAGAPSEAAVRHVSDQPAENEGASEFLGKRTFLFHVSADEPFPMRLIAGTPSGVVMRPVLNAARISILALVGAMVLHTALSVLLSRRMAMPVVRAIERLGRHDGSAARNSTPSYAYLDSLLDRSFERTSDLESRLRQHRETLNSTFLDMLLRGNLRKDDVPGRVAKELGVFSGVRYRVVLFQLASEDNDTELLERGSVYVAAELERVPDARIFSTRPYLIGGVIFAPDGRTDRGPDIRSVTERVASAIDAMVDLHVTIAVGGEVATVWEVSRSFEEALSALDATPEPARSGVIWYDELATDDHGYLLSASTIMNLTHALRNGRTEDVARIFDSIRRANFERTRVSPEAAGVLVRELWVNLVKTAQRLGRAGTGLDGEHGIELPVDLPTSIAPLPPTEQLDAIRRHYDSVARSEAGREHDRRSTLVADTTAYLRDHFSDPNITLSSVADMLGVSQEHLSRTFSRIEHTSFHVYLGLLRISKAKELISAAPDRVSSVYAEVGYSNRATFRRAFQSFEGVTAVQFARDVRARNMVKNRLPDQ